MDWNRNAGGREGLPPFEGPQAAPDSTGRVHNGADDNASGTAALLALGDSEEGRVILSDILGVAGLVPVTAAEHLGPYGEVIRHVPGITTHLLGDGPR